MPSATNRGDGLPIVERLREPTIISDEFGRELCRFHSAPAIEAADIIEALYGALALGVETSDRLCEENGWERVPVARKAYDAMAAALALARGEVTHEPR